MWFWQWFIWYVSTHRTARQVETGFWAVVIVLTTIFFTAWLLSSSPYGLGPPFGVPARGLSRICQHLCVRTE